MASRYRTVHCLIWNDDKFPFMGDDAKLVWFHLLTTPLSTPFGCFKAGMGTLAEEMRWTTERYSKAFQECFQEGLCEYDERHRVVLLKGFLKYNPPKNPNVLKSYVTPFAELPECGLKDKVLQLLKAWADGASKAFRECFRECFQKYSSKHSELSPETKEQEQEQEQDSSSCLAQGPGEEGKLDSPLSQKPSTSKYKFTDWDLTFADDCYKKILVVAPHTKPPNREAWANTIRLMREADKLEPDLINQVFNWANADSFWSTNILSPDKLRKQFGQLSAKMNNPSGQGNYQTAQERRAERNAEIFDFEKATTF